MREAIEACDLVLEVVERDVADGQNFLFHFKPALAHRAFDQACRLSKPRGAVFVDGRAARHKDSIRRYATIFLRGAARH